MMVVLHHLWFSETQLGPFGVKIFFVISGFVMWLTTASAGISPATFWRRRFTRIVPLYWFFLALLVAVALSAPQLLNATVVTQEAILKSFLFIPHYHPVQGFIAPLLVPGWSLNYEMFFYFVFGFALLIKSPSRRAVAIGIVLGGLVLLGLSIDSRDAVVVTYTSPDLTLFIDGVVLAILYRAFDWGSGKMGLILICMGALLAPIGFSRFGTVANFIGLAPAFIVAGFIAIEPTIRRTPSTILHTIGDASYSIYLSHLFALRLFELGWHHVVTFQPSLVLEVVYVGFAFIFAIAGGVAVHYFVERPMLLLFHRNKVAARPVEVNVVGNTREGGSRVFAECQDGSNRMIVERESSS
jgi:exopolysaccharide production protein ExoZ